MKIPLFKIYHDKNDIEAVTKSIKRGMNWAVGPNIEKFEKLISKYLNRKYALTFNSGTSALHSVLMAYGIGKGDEVIVPSFTFIATANAVLLVGAKPVFADIEEETYGLDPKDVERKITKKTKAIIPVHYGGCPCKIKKLKSLAKKHKLLLIEDAAESFGAKDVGKVGDSAMFSFCQTKVFTTGEGGCIVTDNKSIYEKLKLLRSHGKDYVSLGYNFRMSDMVAALGVSQIKKVNKLIKKRRANAKYMTSVLSSLFIPDLPGSTYQEYPVRAYKRDALKNYLAKKGIGTRISFPPIHLTPLYKRVKLEITERIFSQALSLPMYPDLTKREMDYIAKQVKNFYE